MYKLEDRKIMFYGDVKFNLLPLLGWGSHSEVYKIKIEGKEYALKVFNEIYTEHLPDYEEKIDINIDSYVSPLRISYINGKFNGYLMKLCKGENLFDKRLNISVNGFYNSSRKLYDDTYALTKLGYSIFDLYSANVMYDKGFKMIDMDDYRKAYNYDFETLLRLNNIRINALLFDIFSKSTDTENLFIKNEYLCSIKNDFILGKITFDEFFSIIFNIIEGEDVSRISKIGKVLKKNFSI